MGKVTTEITVANHYDEIQGRPVRSIAIEDAIVDSGATLLALNQATIAELGLIEIGKRKVNTASGIRELRTYGTVRLTIQGREGLFEVMELHHPVIRALVGQIPLETFDFLIHPGINRLIPNPFHDNQMVLDQLVTDDLLR